MHYTCSQFRSYEQNVVFCQLSNIPRDLSFLPKKNKVLGHLTFPHKNLPSVLFGHWRAGASAGASLEVSCPGGPPCEAP